MKLTSNEVKVLKLLFIYRGLIAKLLAKFFYSSLSVSESNEKYMYAPLKKLKQKNLVATASILYEERQVSIFYLTSLGIEKAKELLNVGVGQNGTGLLPHDETTVFWDIPAEYQKPPTKQVAHFLLSLEVFLQLEVAALDKVKYCTSHYSPLYYAKNDEKQKLRPDATIFVEGKRYALEVDTGTEWSKQLKEKFQCYKDYCEYCKQYPDKPNAKPIDSIIFIVNDNLTETAFHRRWETVAAVFYEIFGVLYTDINLIYCSVSEIKNVLLLEIKKEELLASLEETALQDMLDRADVKGYFLFKNRMCTYTDSKYSPIFATVNQLYETRTFSDFLQTAVEWLEFGESKQVNFEGNLYVRDMYSLFQAFPTDKVVYNFKNYETWSISDVDKEKIKLMYKTKIKQVVLRLE